MSNAVRQVNKWSDDVKQHTRCQFDAAVVRQCYGWLRIGRRISVVVRSANPTFDRGAINDNTTVISRTMLTLLILAGCLQPTLAWCDEPATDKQYLSLKWEKRFLEVDGPTLPNGPIRTHYLEAYCRPGSTDREWSKTVIRHTSELRSAAANGRRIEIVDRLEDGVVVEHIITAGKDFVDFVVKAHNPTEHESLAHWAQPCMRVDNFTGTTRADARERYPEYIKKCFLMLDDKLTRLPTRPWAVQARYIPGQVYAAPGVDRDDVNPRPLSDLVPSSSLCGCFSADEKQILAVAWEPYQEIFQGVIACMHNDFRIGGLKPGETKTIRGKLYVVPADVEALIARYKKDFQGTRQR